MLFPTEPGALQSASPSSAPRTRASGPARTMWMALVVIAALGLAYLWFAQQTIEDARIVDGGLYAVRGESGWVLHGASLAPELHAKAEDFCAVIGRRAVTVREEAHDSTREGNFASDDLRFRCD